MAERTVLAVFAHPDDEAILCGGTLARCAVAGARVVLVCATRGETGEIADPSLASRETLPAVREAELRAGAGALGLREIELLDYRDGTLGEVPFPDGVERVRALLAAVQPAVVLTFGPEGVYGHADHVAVHRWTKEAFHQSLPPAAQRLYYCAPPRSWYRAISERCRARGVPDYYGPQRDVLGVPDVLVTTRVDVAAYAPARLTALRAHRTQLPPTHPFATLPDADLLELLTAEWFTRAWPPAPFPAADRPAVMETDLLGDGWC